MTHRPNRKALVPLALIQLTRMQLTRMPLTRMPLTRIPLTRIPLTLIILSAAICLTGCATRENPTEPGTVVVPSGDWRLVESGITNSIRAMATNDTMVVAVGDGGIIFSSTDGQTWTEQRENGPNDGLVDIVWTGDQFIAVGWNATMISSPDGINWTWVGIDPHAHLRAVAASDTLLIAVGSSRRVYSSRDGVDWLPLATGIAEEVHDIVYANGLWLIGTGEGKCYRSHDALDWTPQLTIFRNNENFVDLAASDSVFYSLVWIDTTFVAPNQFQVYYSTDALTWFHLDNLDAWNIGDVCWTGSELVAVGEGTNYHLGLPDGLVFSSTGGAAFVEHTTEAPYALTAATMFNDELLIGGSNGYMLGGPQASDLSIRASGAGISGLVWNGTEYVAVTGHRTIMKSTDGESWTETHSRAAADFNRLAFSGAKYVSLGGPGVSLEIYSSTDADTWTRTLEFGDVILRDVTWGGGNFLVCGTKGAVYLSSDGETWNRNFVGDEVTLRSVCYDGSRYLATARSSVYTSTNGIDWTMSADSLTDTEAIIESLAWTGTQYAAVANADSLGHWQGYVYTSPDAVNWTEHRLGAQDFLSAIAWTGQEYVICGRSGTLLTSSNANDWTVVATGTEHTLTSIATNGSQVVVAGANRTVLVQP